MKVPILFHPDMLLHDGGDGHPERPERLDAVRDALAGAPYAESLFYPSVDPAERTALERVHAASYVDKLLRSADAERTFFDIDTRANRYSYRAAALGAGAAIKAVELVAGERTTRPFALSRPPGHHAEPDRAMGFCFINNAAVAAAYAIERLGMSRVAIVDYDVHHGNGTQSAFWARPDVFYASLHQHPLYPGSGLANQRGGGAGVGATLNIPLPAGTGETEYLRQFDEVLVPALLRFQPDLLIVSAGFDAHRSDPLAGMELSSESYAAFARRLLAVAEESARGRIVHILEGGYSLEALAGGVDHVVRELLEQTIQEME